jgi:hypothetical protein
MLSYINKLIPELITNQNTISVNILQINDQV